MKEYPSQQKLLSLLEYEPRSGVLSWKVNRTGGTRRGSEAGSLNNKGYLKVKIGGQQYLAHRLIFIIVNGEAPPVIDHRDGNRRNNAWSNLRPASSHENAANAVVKSNNTTGFKGVCFNKRVGKYQAVIRAAGRQVYLGLYDRPELAHEMYCLAADMVHGSFANHG